MNLTGKKIGIWGFGIAGKAACTCLSSAAQALAVMDSRPMTEEEQTLLHRHNALFFDQKNYEQFFAWCDVVLPSPGIDLRPFKNYAHLFISELDIFSALFQKPIIAITGTVGKTTTTSLLSHVLTTAAGLSVATGGNIGIGVFDLLKNRHEYEYAVLEVSSFQLELCRSFAPTIALLTNFFPNHLDRHGTVEEYWAAKQKIFAHQKKNDWAIMPLEMIKDAPHGSQRIFFTHLDVPHQVRTKDVVLTPTAYHDPLPAHLFPHNCMAVLAVLHALHLPASLFFEAASTFNPQEHRLEKVATHGGIDFYNDSKSTIAQATVAAVDRLQGKPIILLLGGLSKNVDRAGLPGLLKGKVKMIVCFGKEAEDLHRACQKAGIASFSCATLETAIDYAMQHAVPHDQVLLSPAGSSFDLFKNYQERGKRFKELVEGIS